MAIPAISAYPIPTTEYEPAVDWQLDPSRAALLIHDMQEYFITAYDTNQAPMKQVIPNIKMLIDAAETAEIPVFFSAQPPRQQPHRRGLLRDFWGEGMMTAEDAAIISNLPVKDAHHVVTKWRYSALNRTDLRQSLAFANRDQLIITGVYGHMGCKISAADAFMNDIEPFMISDAIADFTEEDHRQTLDWVARRCGRVIDTAEALTELNKLTAQSQIVS